MCAAPARTPTCSSSCTACWVTARGSSCWAASTTLSGEVQQQWNGRQHRQRASFCSAGASRHQCGFYAVASADVPATHALRPCMLACMRRRGKRDEFTIEDASELGELTAVTVGHDGSGKSPAWHLDHVAVTPLYGQQQPGAAGAGSCSWPGSPGAVPSAGSSRPGTPASPSAHGSSSFRSSGAGAACGPADVLLLSSGSGSLRSLRGRCSSGVLLPATPAPVPAAASAAPAAAGVTCLFPCGAWLDERLGDGQTFRRLPRAR